MPVYEHRCPDCQHVFEKLVSFSDSGREMHCPTCGAKAGKLLSTFAAIGGAERAAATVGAPSGGGGGGCCGGSCCGGG